MESAEDGAEFFVPRPRGPIELLLPEPLDVPFETDYSFPEAGSIPASAPSSSMGSPYSDHGQLPSFGKLPEWCSDGFAPYQTIRFECLPRWEKIAPVSFVDPSPCLPLECMASSTVALDASPTLQSRRARTRPFSSRAGLPMRTRSISPFSQSSRLFVPSFESLCDMKSGSAETSRKERCPHPNCGKLFKDLKAHMLTHGTERPEKCPIATCEYHVKGFARKYDKTRHTLTHYKGTMVCGFCPGSGSLAEKSFNRADVFKRHLTAVHGVEPVPPGSRRKFTVTSPSVASAKKLSDYAPDATGQCSTCARRFNNAQELYCHLDDCIVSMFDTEAIRESVEGINRRRLEARSRPKERRRLSSEDWTVHRETIIEQYLPREPVQAYGALARLSDASFGMSPLLQHHDPPVDRGLLTESPIEDPGITLRTPPTGFIAKTLIWLRQSCASLSRVPMVDVPF
ncbi:hypothetical protein B0T16DRAFT_196862 [Cercophora newfieldiana]|uniref:C2H2-type domain-containing protein n=1 Tax=Cercophora newfieldiana TaxID=92897 RepID=A0AA39Y1U1_9PEZI|nr:hypothetical protein B0T16DRAFT_196862 [Cercophora newfieldiana]